VIAPTLTGYLSSAFGYSSIFLAAAAVTCVAMVAMLQVKPGLGLSALEKPVDPARSN
jgi:predicted MFS family arabinose efflux permease